MKRMLFNATHAEETRVGIVDGQKLIDIDIETAGREARKSNIYKGVVTRIEPSLEACFVNYGEDRHGFLPFKEISRAYFKADIDVRTATIRDAITEGQELIVQVEKEERGNKGAALTTFISLAGRYLVLMPNNPRAGGVSRRIEGEERQELREAMDRLDVPRGMSTIARTAGIGRTTEELQWDLNYLLKLWEAIADAAEPQYELVKEENGRRKVTAVTESVVNGKPLKRINPAPFLIVEESNLVVRAIRDYFQPEIGEILVDTDEIYEQARQFMAHVMPDMVNRVKRYNDDIPLFTRFQVEQQIETAYSRTVPLPSGGAIVIDHTEALVAIDVNSARATRGADIEETAFRTNCEAADEVARQMRLRDLGGLIVIDFIDMADQKNQRAVEQRLKDAIRYDRARVQTAKISRFGLMELSRQRLRPSLSEGNHVTCPRCNGVGVIRDTESCALQVLRILQEEAMKEGTGAVHAQVPVDVATFLLNEKRNDITKLEARHRVPVVLIPNTSLVTPHYHIERLRQDDERLDDQQPSFSRAEEIETKADDPYAKKGQEDKPARTKQVPVIKNVLPRDPAPVHPVKKDEEKPAEKTENRPAAMEPVTPQKSFFSRIFSFLFGSSDEKKEEAAKTEAKDEGKEKKREGDRRGRRGGRRGDRRRGERGERADRAEKSEKVEKTDKADVKAEKPADETKPAKPRRERTRRTRREEAPAEKAAEDVTAVTAVEAAVEGELAAEVKAEAVAETAPATDAAPDEAPREEKRRRSRRRRRSSSEGTDEAQTAVAVTEGAEAAEAPKVEQAEAAPAAEVVAPAQVETKAEDADVKTEEKAEGEEGAAEAAPEVAEGEAQEGTRRRRPRRRRRSKVAQEGAEGVETAEATEAEKAEAAEAVETAEAKVDVTEAVEAPAAEAQPAEEALVQIETRPAVEAVPAEEPAAVEAVKAEVTETLEQVEPVEAVVTEAPMEAAEAPLEQVETVKAAEAVEAVEAAPVARQDVHQDDVAAGLEANLARAGLVQVHTKPELVTFRGYEVVKYAGRVTEKRAAEEEGELEQVHTRPELIAPVSYEPVRYPGRPTVACAADEDEGPLVQVHTKTE